MSEALIQVGWKSFGELFRARSKANPMLAGFWLIAVGALLGFLTTLVLPNRIFGFHGIRGASLIASPIVTGFVMDRYGAWLESREHVRSYFATFWGGALFALSMAAVRFNLVAR